MNEIAPVSTPGLGDNSRIRAYDPFRKQLQELKDKNDVGFDYEDAKGNKEARSHVHSLRKVKGELDRVRKAEKAESLALGRRIDAQAQEIETEIEALIEVHQTKIDAIEQREKDRVAKHEEAIAHIEGSGKICAEQWIELPLEQMKESLAVLEAIDPQIFEEFATLAVSARTTARTLVRDAIAKRERHDAEQAELTRLREAEAARKRDEDAERLRKEGEARVRREADEAQQREREASERREREQRDRADQAERDRIAADQRAEDERRLSEERAAKAAKDAEERVLREQEEKKRQEDEEQRKREENKRHRAGVNNAALQAFVKGGLTEEAAKQAVTLIAAKQIPNVTISY